MYSKINSPFAWILTFFLLLFIYTKFIGPIPFSVNSVTTQKSDTFQVSGEGKVIAVPDASFITLGIQSNGQTVKVVQDQINSVINKVSESIKKLGVDAKDIQTTSYNINPNYDYSQGGQRINGYSASTNLSVKVSQIEKINEVIDAATSNGANQVAGINFDVSDKTRLQNEAREKAVANAKKKGEDAARIAGFRLGRIINYNENLGGYPLPVSLRNAGAAEANFEKTQLEPGSQEIVVTVTLYYEIL